MKSKFSIVLMLTLAPLTLGADTRDNRYPDSTSTSLESQSRFKAPADVTNINKTRDLGLGFTIGTANGVTAKYWDTEQTAVEAGVAFSTNNVAANLDYLYHMRSFPAGPSLSSTFAPYAGVGVIAAFGSGTSTFFNSSNTGTGTLGARIPIGMEYLPHSFPLGVFAEIDPGLGLVPNTFGFFQADLGGRWYF